MKDLAMYVATSGDEKRYAFGPDWVAMAMYVDDLYFVSEDEAVLYWYHNIFNKEKKDEEKSEAAEDNSKD